MNTQLVKKLFFAFIITLAANQFSLLEASKKRKSESTIKIVKKRGKKEEAKQVSAEELKDAESTIFFDLDDLADPIQKSSHLFVVLVLRKMSRRQKLTQREKKIENLFYKVGDT
jgi:hypothetical protein